MMCFNWQRANGAIWSDEDVWSLFPAALVAGSLQRHFPDLWQHEVTRTSYWGWPIVSLYCVGSSYIYLSYLVFHCWNNEPLWRNFRHFFLIFYLIVHKIAFGHWPFSDQFQPIKFDFGRPHFLYISIEAIKYGTDIYKNGQPILKTYIVLWCFAMLEIRLRNWSEVP